MSGTPAARPQRPCYHAMSSTATSHPFAQALDRNKNRVQHARESPLVWLSSRPMATAIAIEFSSLADTIHRLGTTDMAVWGNPT